MSPNHFHILIYDEIKGSCRVCFRTWAYTHPKPKPAVVKDSARFSHSEGGPADHNCLWLKYKRSRTNLLIIPLAFDPRVLSRLWIVDVERF